MGRRGKQKRSNKEATPPQEEAPMQQPSDQLALPGESGVASGAEAPLVIAPLAEQEPDIGAEIDVPLIQGISEAGGTQDSDEGALSLFRFLAHGDIRVPLITETEKPPEVIPRTPSPQSSTDSDITVEGLSGRTGSYGISRSDSDATIISRPSDDEELSIPIRGPITTEKTEYPHYINYLENSKIELSDAFKRFQLNQLRSAGAIPKLKSDMRHEGGRTSPEGESAEESELQGAVGGLTENSQSSGDLPLDLPASFYTIKNPIFMIPKTFIMPSTPMHWYVGAPITLEGNRHGYEKTTTPIFQTKEKAEKCSEHFEKLKNLFKNDPNNPPDPKLVYTCDECNFETLSTAELLEHKMKEHNRQKHLDKYFK